MNTTKKRTNIFGNGAEAEGSWNKVRGGLMRGAHFTTGFDRLRLSLFWHIFRNGGLDRQGTIIQGILLYNMLFVSGSS